MVNSSASTPEYIQPRWGQSAAPAELEPVSGLRTNPETLHRKFSIESPKNIYRIRNALPDFAKISTTPVAIPDDAPLYMSEDYKATYIVELPPNEKSLIEQARRCANINTYKTSVFTVLENVGNAALMTGLGAGIGAAAGGVIENAPKIYESIVRGEFYDRNSALSDFANIGAIIGTVPGAIFAGVLGFNAISGVVKRASANTSALVADLEHIAERREKQVIALDNTARTIQVNSEEPNSVIEIKAGKFVSDFLRDLSPNVIEYLWRSGLSDILHDVQAKQTEFENLSQNARYFKVNDEAAKAISAAMVEERGKELDHALQNLVVFRSEVLTEVVRLSLEQGGQQDLR